MIRWFRRRGFAAQVIAIHIATLAVVMVLLAAVSYSHVKHAAHLLAAEISDSRLQGLALDIGRLPTTPAARAEVRKRLQHHLASSRYLNAALVSSDGSVIVTRQDGDPPFEDPSAHPQGAGWRILPSGAMRTWMPLPSGEGHVAATVDVGSVDAAVRDVGKALLALFVVLAVTGGSVFGVVILRHLRGLQALMQWTRAHATRLDADGERPPTEAVHSPELRELGQALQEVMAQRSEQLRAKEEALAAARQSAEAKSRFLATMSHEIRTPLNGIAGMLDLMTHSQPTDEQREYIGIMAASTRQLRGLLNDVLDMSKIEAGRMALEQLSFDLQQHLQDACAPFKAVAEGRGLHFEMRFHVRQRLVRGDPFRITQILNNLLDNALKFTSRGHVAVEVEAGAPDEQGRVALRLVVADSGIGIPQALQAHLFTPFSQADSGVTRRYGGTGLGLALCRQLARLMDGDVGVTSAPDQGARFEVNLVLHADEPRRDEGPVRGQQRLAGREVLVVDDNRVNQLVLQKWLRMEGANTVLAENGEEALVQLGEHRFDAVLMDVSMPVMNGYDAARAIRAMGQAKGSLRTSAHVPILGVTALSLDGEREQCLAAGMNDCITKPVERAVLIDTLQRHLAAQEVVA